MNFKRIYEASEKLDAPLQSVEDGLPVREGTDEDKDTKKPDPSIMKKAADAYDKSTPNVDTEDARHFDTGPVVRPEPKQPPKQPSKFAQLLDDALKQEK